MLLRQLRTCGWITWALLAGFVPSSAGEELKPGDKIPDLRERVRRATTHPVLPTRPGRGDIREDIRAGLQDPNTPEMSKYSLIYHAGNMGMREVQPVLERLSKEDPSVQVRGAAAHVLRLWKERDDERAREKAALEEYRRREAMTPEERRRESQSQAAEQKRLMKESVLRMKDVIIRQLKEGTLEERRRHAEGALGWVEYIPEALPILREIVLKEKDLLLRRSAAVALSNFDGQDAVPALRSCLGPENEPRIRAIGAAGLGLLGHKEAIPVLISLLCVKPQEPFIGQFVDIQLKRITGVKIPYPPYGAFQTHKLTEQELEGRRKAAEAWEAWWKKEGPTLVLPGRTTQPSSQPSAGR